MELTTGSFHRFFLIILILTIGESFSIIPSDQLSILEEPILVNLSQLPSRNINIIDPQALGDFNSLTIPLKRSGRLYFIEAIIDGVQGNLLFDTGATGLVINKTYFRNHAIFESFSSNGITGSTGSTGSTNVKEIKISDLLYKNTRADLVDLSHIENKRGVKVIGLLGFNMIKSFEIVIDLTHNELQLHRIDRKGNRINPQEIEMTQDHTQKIDPWRPVLIVKGLIGGKSLNFCLDTGAETNVINSRSPKSVMSTITITRRAGLGGAGQAINEVLFGTMNDFMLDKYPIRDMETIITNADALSEVYGVTIDGMLGYSFLEKGIITINLAKKQFCIRYLNPTVS